MMGACTDPGHIRNGSRMFDGPFDMFDGNPDAAFSLGSTIDFSCNSGYNMHGSARLECVLQRTGLHSDGGEYRWDKEVPTCTQGKSTLNGNGRHSGIVHLS